MTTIYTVPPGAEGVGRLIAKEEGIIAGLPAAEAAFRYLDANVLCNSFIEDGTRITEGQIVMTVSGPLQPLLSAERVALNILQRLSGIATKTALWASEIAAYPARITDTRKTTPGLRVLEKYAVRIGGGLNHRLALDGGILIKENHILAGGGISAAVNAVRSQAPFTLRVEVEVTTIEELEEALSAGVEIIMLDNMDLETMRRAVKITAGRALLEASGNITLQRLKDIAATGVDLISCGALTHSCRALDFTFLLLPGAAAKNSDGAQ